MNYETSEDFEVSDGKQSITVATYDNGQVVLVAIASTEYMQECAVDIPLNNAGEVRRLAAGLELVARQLEAQEKVVG